VRIGGHASNEQAILDGIFMSLQGWDGLMLSVRGVLGAAALHLGRAPTRAEFLRLTGIHYGRLIPHLPGE
jgi:hypothetical protein